MAHSDILVNCKCPACKDKRWNIYEKRKKYLAIYYTPEDVLEHITSQPHWKSEPSHFPGFVELYFYVVDHRSMWSGSLRCFTVYGHTYQIQAARLEEDFKKRNRAAVKCFLLCINRLKSTDPQHPILKIPKKILIFSSDWLAICQIVYNASFEF